jgi:hypothetical protein
LSIKRGVAVIKPPLTLIIHLVARNPIISFPDRGPGLSEGEKQCSGKDLIRQLKQLKYWKLRPR